MLSGGGAPGHFIEAKIAHAALHVEGVAADTPLRLNNTRAAPCRICAMRALLNATAHDGRVTLISRRCHLARCALFARELGFDRELCAAESRLRWTPTLIYRLAGEAADVCWIDLGTRWARLIGNQRMLARVT